VLFLKEKPRLKTILSLVGQKNSNYSTRKNQISYRLGNWNSIRNSDKLRGEKFMPWVKVFIVTILRPLEERL